MVDEARARELGTEAFESRYVVVLGPAHELEQGWYFPVIMKGTPYFDGVIVNKETGRALKVFIGSDLSGDPGLYDKGYQFEYYDLVILSIEDFDETVRAIMTFGFGKRRTYYRYGKVWRVGKDKFTEKQIRELLSTLPCIFSGFLGDVAKFETARETGAFDFKLFEYTELEDDA